MPRLLEAMTTLAPVPEVVIKSLFVKVPDTVNVLLAIASVPAVMVKFVAVIVPPAVKVPPILFKVLCTI